MVGLAPMLLAPAAKLTPCPIPDQPVAERTCHNIMGKA